MSAITGVTTLQPQVNFSSFSAYSHTHTHTHGEHAVVHEENLPDQECGDTGFCQNAQQCAHRDWKTLRKSNLFLFKSRSRVTWLMAMFLWHWWEVQEQQTEWSIFKNCAKYVLRGSFFGFFFKDEGFGCCSYKMVLFIAMILIVLPLHFVKSTVSLSNSSNINSTFTKLSPFQFLMLLKKRQVSFVTGFT